MKRKEHRYNVGGRFFIYAPAHKGIRSKATGRFVSKRLERINPPYGDAEAWKCNLYYFWWEFMKRNPEVEYHLKQKSGHGLKGKMKILTQDWGNIFNYGTYDFWTWWRERMPTGETRGEYLFAEPVARKIQLIDKETKEKDILLLQVPMEVRDAHLVKMFRKILNDHEKTIDKVRSISKAKYKIHTPVRLTSLYHALRIWDARTQNPMAKLYELPDLAKIPQNTLFDGISRADYIKAGDTDLTWFDTEMRQRKTKVARRYLNAAETYSKNAVSGYFPHNPKSK
jgi:hypothetical protein